MIDQLCLRCDYYDPDYECTMNYQDRSYACLLSDDYGEKEERKSSRQQRESKLHQ